MNQSLLREVEPKEPRPLVTQSSVFMWVEFLTGPGEWISFASVSTKHSLLSLPIFWLVLGDLEKSFASAVR